MKKTPLILLMAGGTGGHIFPALAVAESLHAQGWNSHWLGSENGMEVSLIPKYGIDLSLLPIVGVRGKSLVVRLFSPLLIIKAIWQAIQIIRRIKPDVILGMGGFASGPGGIAAWLLKIPLCIHEQNAISGVTNKILSKVATYKLQAFPGAIANADAVTGNPVRKDICDIEAPEKRFINHQGAIRLLIIGGSRGAAILNELVPESIKLLPESIELNVWHQVGANNHHEVTNRYSIISNNHESKNIKITIDEFIDEMNEAYQWADVVICRSGALTVSEVAVVGLGAIFIPFPYAVDDHQTANAKYLSSAKAAEIIQQSELNPELLANKIIHLAERNRCLEMAKKARAEGKPNATSEVADYCIKAANLTHHQKAA